MSASAASSPSALTAAFRKGRPALVAYVMGGYPDRAGSLEALRVLVEAGVDVIELGVPYTDPLADGPVICSAGAAARDAAGGVFGLAETIELARDFIAEAGEKAPPVVLMGYLNPLMRMGYRVAADAIREAGVAGVIVPDLPPGMAEPWLDAADGLETVFLAAPTSTPERLKLIGALSRGFVYCVSTTGVTGERGELPSGLAELVERVEQATDLPVAVGFGVSTPEQAATVAEQAEGVVVGSAIVKRQHDPGELEAFASKLAESVHESAAGPFRS